MRKILIVLLFLITVFFYFNKLGTVELRGDEAVTFIALVPFFQALLEGRFFPSFLTFFHEPLHLVIQTPFIFFGLSEFWARFPNALAGVLTFVVLYQWQKSLLLLILYTFSGFFLLFRTGLNIGVFSLVLTLFLYYFYRGDIRKSFVFLFLLIFIFIDAAFILPGLLAYFLIHCGFTNSIKKYLKILIVGIIFGLILWFLVIFAGSVLSGLYNWQTVAPARLFLRGTKFSFLSPINNWETLVEYNSLFWVFGLIFFLCFSFRDKKARDLWIIFSPVFLFFNIVATPTVHLFEFLIPILVLASYGAKQILKPFLIVILLIMIFFNLIFINDRLKNLRSENVKMAATYVQKHTVLCEKVLTDMDGYKFRLYFGRGYIQSSQPVKYQSQPEDKSLFYFSNLLPYESCLSL